MSYHQPASRTAAKSLPSHVRPQPNSTAPLYDPSRSMTAFLASACLVEALVENCDRPTQVALVRTHSAFFRPAGKAIYHTLRMGSNIPGIMEGVSSDFLGDSLGRRTRDDDDEPAAPSAAKSFKHRLLAHTRVISVLNHDCQFWPLKDRVDSRALFPDLTAVRFVPDGTVANGRDKGYRNYCCRSPGLECHLATLSSPKVVLRNLFRPSYPVGVEQGRFPLGSAADEVCLFIPSVHFGDWDADSRWESQANIFELFKFVRRFKIVFWPNWETEDGSTTSSPGIGNCACTLVTLLDSIMSANQLTFVGLETVKFDDDDVGGYQVPAPNPDSGVAPQSHDASACQAANLYLERWVKRRHRSATFLTISQYLDDKESRPFEIADGD